MINRVHIFYHNDADGYAAGYLMMKHYRDNSVSNPEIFMHEMDYQKNFPFEKIQPKDLVIIVDYSLVPEDMNKLMGITNYIIWIDHHRTAMEYDYSDGEKNIHISGVRMEGLSGCALTWLYLKEWFDETDGLEELSKELILEKAYSHFTEHAPKWLIYINDWDIWKHEYVDTKPFVTSLNSKLSMETIQDLDHYMYQTDLLVEEGKKYIEYRNAWAKQFMEKYGFETKIFHQDNCYTTFIANLGNANSEFFGDLINKYEIVGTMCFNGKNWTVSLYSNKPYVNCGSICKEYNGGGHPGAAGFISNEMPFKEND